MMKRTGVILIIVLLCGIAEIACAQTGQETDTGYWTYQDFLDKKTPQSYTIRPDHPRLLITSDNKAEIIDKIQAAPAIWREVIRNADRPSGVYSEKIVICCGLIYQIGCIPGFTYSMTREEYAQKGVTELMQLPADKPIGWPRMLSIPLGYDWLFELLSFEQKQDLVNKMAYLSPFLDNTPNMPSGRGIIMGLAFYGDGVDDASAENIVSSIFHNIWWNSSFSAGWASMPLMLIYLEDGGWTESMSYFAFNSYFFPCIAAWKTATGQDYFSKMGYFRNVPYWMANAVVPRLKTMSGYNYSLPLYDYTSERINNYGYGEMIAASTGYLKDVDPVGAALAKWWADTSCPVDILEYSYIYSLLIGDPRVQGKSPVELGLPETFLMKGLNNVYLRSAWEDPDATVVGFANSRFFVRASGENSFCLWKNGGALFPYRGKTIYHDYWYPNTEAYPKNGVIFYEGSSLIQPLHTTSMEPAATAIGSKSDVGTLRVESLADEYDYVRGTCPKTYYKAGAYPKNSPVPANIKQAERTLVYLRPLGGNSADWIIILDRLETDSSLKRPHIVFNTIFEPKTGKTWDTEDKGDLVLDGQWKVDNAPCVVITNEHLYKLQYSINNTVINAHSRAFLKTLYPEEIETYKIGGDTHFLDGLNGEVPHNFADNCKEFNDADTNQKVMLGGWWRFHVVPKIADTKHTVLTAIEAVDSSVQQPQKMELLKSADILGAQVGPNLVLFSANGNKISSASVKAPALNNGRLLICDLTADTAYELKIGSDVLNLTANSEGIIFIKDLMVNEGDSIVINGGNFKLEDINLDGKVDVLDVQLCVNVLLGIEKTPVIVQKAKAIAEPEDKCTLADVQAVVNKVLGK